MGSFPLQILVTPPPPKNHLQKTISNVHISGTIFAQNVSQQLPVDIYNNSYRIRSFGAEHS